MLDAPEFDRWREEAGRAFEAARVQRAAGLHNWSCFAAEQSAQLAIKSLLHGLGLGPWGPDLVRLAADAHEAVAELWSGDLDASLRGLSRHYIPARHPDAYPEGAPGGHYGEEDSALALDSAARILAAIEQLWSELGGKG